MVGSRRRPGSEPVPDAAPPGPTQPWPNRKPLLCTPEALCASSYVAFGTLWDHCSLTRP